MGASTLKIHGEPSPGRFELELNGRPLRGVVAFQVGADIRGGGKICQATITFHARLDIDAELETQLVRDPGESPWSRLRRALANFWALRRPAWL